MQRTLIATLTASSNGPSFRSGYGNGSAIEMSVIGEKYQGDRGSSRTMKHSWGLPHRFLHKTERECTKNCGIVKVTRHEGDEHWIEFWRDGEQIKGDRTPACERVKADA